MADFRYNYHFKRAVVGKLVSGINTEDFRQMVEARYNDRFYSKLFESFRWRERLGLSSEARYFIHYF